MTTIARKNARWTPLGIAAMILGFAVWWPIGLAIIGYILWGGSIDALLADAVDEVKKFTKTATQPQRSSGNAAFNAYRDETLRRLEQEQAEFEEFMAKLREARDREEFEKFMKQRKNFSDS